MPTVRDMSTRYDKYSLKQTGERVGSRYTASKSIAVSRYIDGIASVRPIVDTVKKALDASGVPAGQYALYLSFAQYVAKRMVSYGGATLDNRVLGAMANWTARGADPAVLEKVVNILRGYKPTTSEGGGG